MTTHMEEALYFAMATKTEYVMEIAKNKIV